LDQHIYVPKVDFKFKMNLILLIGASCLPIPLEQNKTIAIAAILLPTALYFYPQAIPQFALLQQEAATAATLVRYSRAALRQAAPFVALARTLEQSTAAIIATITNTPTVILILAANVAAVGATAKQTGNALT
jgi:hypothetical protein